MSRMRKPNKERRVRRGYTPEFKAGAVRLVLDEEKTVGAAARELDLTPSALGVWVRQARADLTKGKTGLTTDERAELSTLRKENRELKMERDILKKRRGLFRQEPSVVFAWIEAEKAEYPVTKLCEVLQVSTSGFYASQGRPESTHAQRDRHLRVLIHASFQESRTYYGSPRVHRDLFEDGIRVSPKRVARLMQEDGLIARRRKRFKVTTMSDHDQPIAANLLDRQFEAKAPNHRWVTNLACASRAPFRSLAAA